eukprot:1160409-Pelagomonas_calceolata.AAC.6
MSFSLKHVCFTCKREPQVRPVAPRPLRFSLQVGRPQPKARPDTWALDYKAEDVPLSVLAGYPGVRKVPDFAAMQPHKPMGPTRALVLVNAIPVASWDAAGVVHCMKPHRHMGPRHACVSFVMSRYFMDLKPERHVTFLPANAHQEGYSDCCWTGTVGDECNTKHNEMWDALRDGVSHTQLM